MTIALAFLGAVALAALFATAFLVSFALTQLKDANEVEVKALRDQLFHGQANARAERGRLFADFDRLATAADEREAELAAKRWEREIAILDRCLAGYSAKEHLNLEAQRLLNESQQIANEAYRQGRAPTAPPVNDRASQEEMARLYAEARAMGMDGPGLGEA